jgi:hypothetical protein
MDMDFDVAEAFTRHPGKKFDQFRTVFFLRIEKGVLRRQPAGVPVAAGDFGPVFRPQQNPVAGQRVVCIVPVGLVVIGDRRPDSPWRGLVPPLQAVPKIRQEPNLSMPGESHERNIR